MSERINLAEIEARCKRAIDGWPRIWSALCVGDEDAQLLGSDLPALVAWVKGAARVLGIAREGCASAGATYAVAGIDVLLSRLKEKP